MNDKVFNKVDVQLQFRRSCMIFHVVQRGMEREFKLSNKQIIAGNITRAFMSV